MYTPPVTPWELVIPEAGSLTCLQEGAIEGRISDWGEVVTRYPYENVGMDHLLSKEKGRRQKSLQAKNRRRRNLGKKEEKEILQTVMFSFER